MTSRHPNMAKKVSTSNYEGEGNFWSNAECMVVKDTRDLCEDIKYVISVPDLCDVTFLVGPDRLPVYGIKAILATRSRHFYQLLLSAKQEMQNRSTKRRSVAKKAIKKMKHMLGLSSADKASTFHQNEVVHKLTIEVENFDVMVFERFMCYVHCGTVAVNISNVVGLMNAAHTYDFPELLDACWDFANSYIKPDTLSKLIASTSSYIHFKYTRMLIQEIHRFLREKPELMTNNTEISDVNEEGCGEYML